MLLPYLGVEGPVIDCLVDQDSSAATEEGGAVATLVVLPPPRPQWRVPDGMRWHALNDADPAIEHGLKSHLAQLLAEYRGLRPISDLRSPWSRDGWYQGACTWIERALADTDRPPPLAVTQVRHWGISAVMRIDSENSRCWFKAIFRPFRREALTTAFLDRELPGSVAPVIAIEADEGWLLLDDSPGSQTEV